MKLQFFSLLTIILLYSSASFAKIDSTDTRLYRPFSEAPLQVSPQIQQRLSGHCDKQSTADRRQDAWECLAQGRSYDPCFKHPYSKSKSLLCPLSPWSNEAVEITVTKPLSNLSHQALDMSKTLPWAVELTDGKTCKIITHNDNSSRRNYSYRCNQDSFLLGRLKRCYNFWQIYLKEGEEFKLVKVKRAWF